jgi:hypothetical protein
MICGEKIRERWKTWRYYPIWRYRMCTWFDECMMKVYKKGESEINVSSLNCLSFTSGDTRLQHVVTCVTCVILFMNTSSVLMLWSVYEYHLSIVSS